MRISQYLLLLNVLLLPACGGGSNGGTDPDIKTGYFRDSAVKGLTYKTSTMTGVTDLSGTYQYKDGEEITFSLGSLVLGKTRASEVLYPHNIANDGGIKIAQFLQTLDENDNPNDGINVVGQFTGSGTTLPDNLTQEYIDNNAKNKTLVTKEKAQEHLNQTLANGVHIGYFKGKNAKGLTYKTETQTGKTDTLGHYKYKLGEQVKFYLGSLYLGQSLATEIVYPSDIASSNIEMVKITQLLQTLDADNNPSNGIDVDRSFSTTDQYLPDGDLTQTHINLIDSSKLLVDKVTAKTYLINAINADRNTTDYIEIDNTEASYNFEFPSAGVREFEIATLACTQVTCCKASVVKGGIIKDTIVDQNRAIHFNVLGQVDQSISIKIQQTGEQSCYYKTPIASNVQVLTSIQKTIIAQGDGNDYSALNVLKSNQRYYLRDDSHSTKIRTIKAIGLGNGRIKHTAKAIKYLDKDGVDAHANSIKVYNYLKNVLGINSYDNANASLSATTNFLYPRSDINSCGTNNKAGSWFNAFYSGGNIYYTPAKPNQGYDNSLSSATNVAAHEWGHAVTRANSNLTYSRESGAINEAFSDWLGIAVEQYYTTGEKSWVIGLADHPFRSMKNPAIYARTYKDYKDYKVLKDTQVNTPNVGDKIPYPDTYQGENWLTADTTNCPNPNSCTNDNCGVHINSSVANKMFYLLSVGGTHNGVTVTGIGIDNAIKIALDANQNYWNNSTTFHNAKAGMITAAVKYGDTSAGINMQAQVQLAWKAINVLDANQPIE